MEYKKNRKRYNYKENSLIEFFLLINSKHIWNCYFQKKNYLEWYKKLKLLLPNRSLNNLKSKIFKTIKFKFKKFIIKLDGYLPSLKFQIQNEIVIPNYNHFKYYFKYLNEQRKKFYSNDLEINFKFYLIFINNQENIFAQWNIDKNRKINSKNSDEDLFNLCKLKNHLKILIKNIDNESLKINEFKMLSNKWKNYLNSFDVID